MTVNDAELRSMVMEILEPRLASAGIAAEELDDRVNLVEVGVVDSFSFLELAAEIEQKTGRILDFSETDPEDFTTVGGLLRILQP